MGKKFKEVKEKEKEEGEGGVEKMERVTKGNIEIGLIEVDVNWSLWEGTFRLEKKERNTSILKEGCRHNIM